MFLNLTFELLQLFELIRLNIFINNFNYIPFKIRKKEKSASKIRDG